MIRIEKCHPVIFLISWPCRSSHSIQLLSYYCVLSQIRIIQLSLSPYRYPSHLSKVLTKVYSYWSYSVCKGSTVACVEMFVVGFVWSFIIIIRHERWSFFSYFSIVMMVSYLRKNQTKLRTLLANLVCSRHTCYNKHKVNH